MTANLSRISDAMSFFRAWARDAKLIASETAYVARTAAREPLRFSKSGDPRIEAAYRTHWVSPALGDKKRERLAAKVERPPELVVIEPRNHDWKCHKCGGAGSLLMMEPEGPACLPCAGLGDLAILSSGDAKLTRKARSASSRTAVIMRWSRSRDRYERVGSLVEPEALARACAELGLPDASVTSAPPPPSSRRSSP